MADISSANYPYPQSAAGTALAAVMESSAMVYEIATSSAMMYDTTTSAAMMHPTATAIMHEVASAAIIKETTSAAMAHETMSTMMHGVTSAVAAYTASVSPPMAHGGPMTHTVSQPKCDFWIGIYS